MADDILKELLTSPLEKPVKRRRRNGEGESGSEIVPGGTGERGTEKTPMTATPVLAAGAAVLGAAIVLLAYSVGSSDTTPTTTIATTTTTTVATDVGAPTGLPDDYTAVGDRLGMRVERILQRSDGVFVTVTTVVENSFDPDLTTGFQGGVWTLVLADGRRITSTNESFDALARGTVSVHFPPEGFVVEDIEAIEVNGVADRLTTVVDAVAVSPVVIPDDGSAVTLDFDRDRFGIDVGVSVAIDVFEVSQAGAAMEWSLESDVIANASVLPILILESEDDTVEMLTRSQTTGFSFFHPSIPTAALGSGGVFAFDPTTPDGLTAGPWTAQLSVQVTWATYQPLVAILPIDGAAVAVVTG